MRALIVVLVLLNLVVGGYILWVKSSSSLSDDRISLYPDRISLRRAEVSVTDKPGAPPRQETGTEQICVEWRGLAAAEFEGQGYAAQFGKRTATVLR